MIDQETTINPETFLNGLDGLQGDFNTFAS